MRALRKLSKGEPQTRGDLFGVGYSTDKAFNSFIQRVLTRMKELGLVIAHGSALLGDTDLVGAMLTDEDAITELIWPGSRSVATSGFGTYPPPPPPDEEEGWGEEEAEDAPEGEEQVDLNEALLKLLYAVLGSNQEILKKLTRLEVAIFDGESAVEEEPVYPPPDPIGGATDG